MKTFMLVMFVSSVVVACPAGTTLYEGVCAGDPKPVDSGMFLADTVKPSDEKPNRHPESVCDRGEVHCDTPPSCASTRACSDDMAINASAEGKKAAGIK